VNSPLTGIIKKIVVKVGQAVKRGDTLLILVSKQMENKIIAERDGIVKGICVSSGQRVEQNDLLVILG